MAIDFEEFNRLGSSNAKNKILDFLKKEKSKAFEYKELAKLVNESERTVNAYLSLLKSEGKVLHKQPYWAYNRDYSEESGNDLKEIKENKVVPSTFRHEGGGIFSYNRDSSIKLDLNGSIKMVERELTKQGLSSQNIGGFYYLLRKRAGLLNKRNELPKRDDEIIRRESEIAIDVGAEGFGEGLQTNYGKSQKGVLSKSFADLMSEVVKLERIYGHGNSKRYQIIGNNKKFMVKERSEIKNGRYFFGIGEEAYRTFNNENSFLILLCSSLKEVIIVPMYFIMKYLLKIPTVTADQWKFNIIVSVEAYYLEIPKLTKLDVTPFLNRYDQLFNEKEIATIEEKIDKINKELEDV